MIRKKRVILILSHVSFIFAAIIFIGLSYFPSVEAVNAVDNVLSIWPSPNDGLNGGETDCDNILGITWQAFSCGGITAYGYPGIPGTASTGTCLTPSETPTRLQCTPPACNWDWVTGVGPQGNPGCSSGSSPGYCKCI